MPPPATMTRRWTSGWARPMPLSCWTSTGSSFPQGRRRRFSFRMWIGGGVGGQNIVPHSLDIASQLGEAFLRCAVVASRPFPAIAYKSRSAKHAQVLGDAGLADPGDSGQLTDRVCATAKALEQRAPGRIGQRHHYRSIGHALYRRTCMDKSTRMLSSGFRPPLGLRPSRSATSLLPFRELRRRLTPPRFGDEHLEVFDRHSIESYKHGREAVIMRFGKKLLSVGGQ